MPDTFLHGVELLEVDTGTRPIRSVRSSVIGIVGTGESSAVAASLSFGASTSQVIFTAATKGVAGNLIAIQITAGTGTQPLAVTKSTVGSAVTISINLQDAAGLPISTAAQVIAAVNAAQNVVVASKPPASNGLGPMQVASPSKQFLTGGIGIDVPLDTPTLFTSAKGVEDFLGANSYLTKAIKAIYKQTGALMVVVRTTGLDNAATLTGVYALKKAQTMLGYTPRIILRENVTTVGISDAKSFFLHIQRE